MSAAPSALAAAKTAAVKGASTTAALDAMLQKGDLQLVCTDGKVMVDSHLLVLASPDMLAGAVEAAQGEVGGDASGQGGKASCNSSGQVPVIKVDGKVSEWKLVLRRLYPLCMTQRPTLEELQDMLPIVHKYGMLTLMDYIQSTLADQLDGKLTIAQHTGPTFVFKWLKVADDLQLDYLRDMCIDALGTYLLPTCHKFIASHHALLAGLSGPTFASAMAATALCSDCVMNAGKPITKMCSGNCPPTGLLSAAQSPASNVVQKSRADPGNCCSVCSFKPKIVIPPRDRIVNVCVTCRKIRTWVRA